MADDTFSVVEDMPERCAMADDPTPFGWHLLCSVDDCAPICMSVDRVMRFAFELVGKIGMRVHSSDLLQPQAEWYGSGGAEGVTAVVPLDTSSIVVHTQEVARMVHFEIWSCKRFDAKVATDHAIRFFGGVVRNSRFVTT